MLARLTRITPAAFLERKYSSSACASIRLLFATERHATLRKISSSVWGYTTSSVARGCEIPG